EYYSALLNNQPMGFYSPEVIAGDARRHGIELVRPDINLSSAGCAVEADRRIRLGLASVKGLGTRLGSARVAPGRGREKEAAWEVDGADQSSEEQAEMSQALGIAERIVDEREANGAFLSLHECAQRTGLKPGALESLVLGGAFDSMSSSRRDLLWQLG